MFRFGSLLFICVRLLDDILFSHVMCGGFGVNPMFIYGCVFKDKMVPGGRIEPPTQGFSIPCSTPELPGHG